jgi:hypothetical protein
MIFVPSFKVKEGKSLVSNIAQTVERSNIRFGNWNIYEVGPIESVERELSTYMIWIQLV